MNYNIFNIKRATHNINRATEEMRTVNTLEVHDSFKRNFKRWQTTITNHQIINAPIATMKNKGIKSIKGVLYQ